MMSDEQGECFIELSGFDDLVRLACAFHDYPRRIYSQDYDGSRVLSCSVTLANTLLIFYTPMSKSGRYVSYQVMDGKEVCDIVDSTKSNYLHAPIIHMKSEISSLPVMTKNPPDQFHPIEVSDLGSLARLTYDPEFPDEQNITLYVFPFKDSWMLGYITSMEMDETYYNFNYVKLDSEPTKHFVKYRGARGLDLEFSDKFEHGYPLLPIIKIKSAHPIFGFDD